MLRPALAQEGRVGVTLGRHINDEVTSFYSNSPSGFMVEYGWGGRVIDVDGWQPQEVTWGPSMWGHDRMWMTEEGRIEWRKLRIARRRHRLAQAGERDRRQL